MIADGYIYDSKFPGSGWAPPFTYKFRPAMHARVTSHREDVKNAPAKVVSQKQVDFLREHITSWDRADQNGVALALTDTAAWESLSDSAIGFMYADVAGYGADTWQAAAKNSPSPVV
jgi:hypothetical protein